MDSELFLLAKKIVPPGYIQQAEEAKSSRKLLIKQLLEKKKWPEDGWDDATVELFLSEAALMDSNNFPKNVGVGEREARIFSDLVRKRHLRFGHGIGRSGDLVEMQPKAAGSSLINALTNALALDALRTLGVQATDACFVSPMATGMSLSLVLLTLRQDRPNARHVIWHRIDQKSCLKCIMTSGFQPLQIKPRLIGDELQTDVDALESILKNTDPETIAAVLTTTSCFAPRAADDVENVAKLCQQYNIPHVINNAYGVQSTKCMHIIQQASRVGRVDAYVQSTDKNFMVPVGGSIIAGFDKAFISRASVSVTLDLFITLVSMGSKRYKELVRQRKENFTKLKTGLINIAQEFGERVLHTPGNNISMALSLGGLSMDPNRLTELGSMLFTRCVSGTRVVTSKEAKIVNGIAFQGWGSHHDMYLVPYLTAAAGIGMSEGEIETFLKRLSKTIRDFRKVPLKPSVTALTDSMSECHVADEKEVRENEIVEIDNNSDATTKSRVLLQRPTEL